MKIVQPIRDPDQISRSYEIARERSERDYLLLLLGFNTARRISDLVKLRVSDVLDQEYLRIEEQKTGKETRLYINPGVRREVNALLRGKPTDAFLFPSRQRDSRTLGPRALSRQRTYQILNEIFREAGVKDRVGNHTLRKTFGFHYYKKYGDVVSLQRILQHSSNRETLLYIGIRDDEIDESIRGFSIRARR